ncbi:MAG: hypothetical protein ACYS17_10800 [Planctomycetota bacterium]
MVRKTLSLSQRRQFEGFGAKINKFGVNFAVCNTADEVVLLCEGGKFDSNSKQLIKLSRQVLDQNSQKICSDKPRMSVWRFGDANLVLAVVLKTARVSNKDGEVKGTALIDLGEKSQCQGSVPTSDAGCANPVQTDSDYFAEMLELLEEKFQAETKAEKQIEMVGTELAQTYEELVLLHKRTLTFCRWHVIA